MDGLPADECDFEDSGSLRARGLLPAGRPDSTLICVRQEIGLVEATQGRVC
jgi:hypothetical protein